MDQDRMSEISAIRDNHRRILNDLRERIKDYKKEREEYFLRLEERKAEQARKRREKRRLEKESKAK